LKKLFPNLIDCDQQQFARKLGNFLRSLALKPGTL
jgi:hypothetical protein